jgi:hypothetical protein
MFLKVIITTLLSAWRLAIVTQGKTLDETIANLEEAVALHLEGENSADFDLISNPSLFVTMQLERSDVAEIKTTFRWRCNSYFQYLRI